MSVKKSKMNGQNELTDPASTSESKSKNETETSLATAPGVSPSTEALPVSDLSTVISESQAVMNEVPPEPKKIGRPKGSKTKTGKPPEETPPIETPSPQVSLAPLLGKIASLPYGIAATRTRFEGFNLSHEEQLEIGGTLDAVVQKYFPNLSESAGVGVMAGFTILSVTMMKMQAYESWKMDHAKVVETESKVTETEIKTGNTPDNFFT